MIGGTCKRSNAFSGPVLIARGLDFEHVRCSLWSFEGAPNSALAFTTFGGHSGGETPLPIPNREVKPASADGTRRATSRESRSPPNYFEGPPRAALFLCRAERARRASSARSRRTRSVDRRMGGEERGQALLLERIDVYTGSATGLALELRRARSPGRAGRAPTRARAVTRSSNAAARSASNSRFGESSRWTNAEAIGPRTNRSHRAEPAADPARLDDHRGGDDGDRLDEDVPVPDVCQFVREHALELRRRAAPAAVRG